MQYPEWNIEAETGYKPITTFWMDFSIADTFGCDAVQDTYNRAFSSWKNNYRYLTELVMVLNWKCWQHYNAGDNDNAGDNAMLDLYSGLYYAARDYALDNLKGEEFEYFVNITD